MALAPARGDYSIHTGTARFAASSPYAHGLVQSVSAVLNAPRNARAGVVGCVVAAGAAPFDLRARPADRVHRRRTFEQLQTGCSRCRRDERRVVRDRGEDVAFGDRKALLRRRAVGEGLPARALGARPDHAVELQIAIEPCLPRAVVDAQAVVIVGGRLIVRRERADHQRVVDRREQAFAQPHSDARLVRRRGLAVRREDARHVVDRRPAVDSLVDDGFDLRCRQQREVRDAVGFDTAVAVGLRLHDQRVGDRARVALVDVQRIVADVQADEVVDVDGAAEEFQAIVEHRVDLDVADDRVTPDRAKCDAVQLVAVADGRSGVLDDDVLETARAVVVVVAAVVVLVETQRSLGLDVAFAGQRQVAARHGAGIGALVRDAEAVDHQAAPLLDVEGADRAVHVGKRSDRDRRIRPADREELRSAVDHHELAVRGERERGAGLDRQDRTVAAFRDAGCGHRCVRRVVVADEQAALKDVGAVVRQIRDRHVDREIVAGVHERGRVRAVGAVISAANGLTGSVDV